MTDTEINQPETRRRIVIPAFWHKHPEEYFINIDAVFAAENVTNDDYKFNLVVSKFDEDLASKLSRTIITIRQDDQDNKYDRLKNAIIEKYSIPLHQRAQSLLAMQNRDIGDMRPSDVLQEMANLAHHETDNMLFVELFLSRMPYPVRQALSYDDAFQDLAKAGTIADQVYTQCGTSSTVNSVRHDQDYRAPGRGNRGRSTSTNHQFRPRNPNHLCRYHFQFGARARSCMNPCAWRTMNSSNRTTTSQAHQIQVEPNEQEFKTQGNEASTLF